MQKRVGSPQGNAGNFPSWQSPSSMKAKRTSELPVASGRQVKWESPKQRRQLAMVTGEIGPRECCGLP